MGDTGNRYQTQNVEYQGALVDSFGRLRTSSLRNIFQYTFRDNFDFDIYWDLELTGSATSQQINQRVVRELGVTTATGDKAIIQSRRYLEYYAGKSHLMKYTANFKGVQDGVVKRHGMFDNNNGIFFEADGTTLNVCIRSNISGSVVDTKIPQSLWNGDKLDGLGVSGHTANPENKYVFWIDYAWLSSGGVRFGLYLDGRQVILHSQYYSGSQVHSYSASALLPFRSEVEVTGSPVSVDTMEITCCSLEVEGNPSEIGRVRSLASEFNDITVNTGVNAVAAFRINPNAPYASVEFIETLISVVSGNSTVHWELFANPTITGPSPVWVNANASCVQYASNATSLNISGGLMFADGYARVDDDSQTKTNLTDVFMGRAIDGTSDIFVLSAGTLSSNSKLVFVETWKEFR